MRCFYCGSELSSVIDKRAVKSTGEIRRRRECLKCQRRYTTYERVLALELVVIKRDGRRQLFDREKLRNGIVKSLEKRPAFARVEEITTLVERKIWGNGEKQVESKVIGIAILNELKKLDKIAYIRFASVYRNFENTNDFTKELKSLGSSVGE